MNFFFPPQFLLFFAWAAHFQNQAEIELKNNDGALLLNNDGIQLVDNV